MRRDAVLNVWAAEGAPWSPWVKPVLFAHMDPDLDAPAAASHAAAPHWKEILESPSASKTRQHESEGPYRSMSSPRDVAVVVDLPGASGVDAGLDLAELGFRPVPLYNAVPGPFASAVDWREGSAHSTSTVSLVDVVPIVRALAVGASVLAARKLPLDAPPAFLLDAHRCRSAWPASSGRFDNRSMCFVTDFPSAELLVQSGVRRVVLVRASRFGLEDDLAVTLHGWQKHGLEMRMHAVDEGGLEPLEIASSWARAFKQLFRRATLRPHRLGGFGEMIPEHAAG
jgi:hypothetical protein